MRNRSTLPSVLKPTSPGDGMASSAPERLELVNVPSGANPASREFPCRRRAIQHVTDHRECNQRLIAGLYNLEKSECGFPFTSNTVMFVASGMTA